MTLADAGLWLMALSVLASAGFDLRTFEIPDTITVLIIIGAVLFGLGTPGFDWASHAAAGGAFFAFGLLAFARGWLGGGDVKVMTGCACWATLGTLAAQVVLIAIAGGVLALVLMLLRRGWCRWGPICPMPWALPAAWRCGAGGSCRCPDRRGPVARLLRHQFDISQPPNCHLTVTMP